jgi:hypothetical protein
MIAQKVLNHRMNLQKRSRQTKKIFSGLWLLCFFVANVCLVASSAFAQPSEAEPKDGDAIAYQLRTMQPGGNTEISGVLIINNRQKIPVICNIVTNRDSWKVIYETRPTTNSAAEKFITVHSLAGPNKYFYSRAPTPNAPLPDPKPLTANEAAIPLAGSDFWLSELGFDFLHWPFQKKLPGQMRLGQPCYVLESINPDAQTVVRVKSFIDKESGGILIAEAYDRNKKLVKEFSLGGSSFKKINGQWQLKKMKIGSPKNDSETVLEFDLPEEVKTQN